ncbi:MAG: hypothetical protein ACXABK_04140 [Candidatus Heimdallarchaeaceae archaeon]|jgi:hypothetical protein
MVFNPYDSHEADDDPRKAKLKAQAQEQFIAQLQQRIANQSGEIENLQAEIQRLNNVISEKIHEIETYSKRVEEERMFFEQDKKARSDREYELQKKIQQVELEAEKIKANAQVRPQTIEPVVQIESQSSSKINDYIEILMSNFRKPTNDSFVVNLKNLIDYSGQNGTIDQRILGILLNSEMPQTEEKITERLNTDPNQVNRALFRLLQKETIKKVGKGFVVISSNFAEMTDIQQNWKSLPADQIYANLLSILYVSSDKDDIVSAFTNARDALMESGALSSVKTHELSQLIEKIKRHSINTQELVEKIQEWKVT